MLHHGLYEQVINNALTSELSEIPEARKAVAPIGKAEASKVLAQYLADVVQKGLDNVLDNGGDLSAQIALTNQIVSLIQNTTKEADFPDRTFSGRGEKDRQAAFGSRQRAFHFRCGHLQRRCGYSRGQHRALPASYGVTNRVPAAAGPWLASGGGERVPDRVGLHRSGKQEIQL